MTENQSCPLCGEKLEFFTEEEIKDTNEWNIEVECKNQSCGLYGQTTLYYTDIKKIASQIARIKQEAKQEFANDLDSNSTNVSDHSGNSIRRYIEFKESVYKKIKKKHGVK